LRVELELWQFLSGMVIVSGAIAWIVGLWWRQHGHEDICARRYQEIEITHTHLVKTSDERHQETRERFTFIEQQNARMDVKIDALLARREA